MNCWKQNGPYTPSANGNYALVCVVTNKHRNGLLETKRVIYLWVSRNSVLHFVGDNTNKGENELLDTKRVVYLWGSRNSALRFVGDNTNKGELKHLVLLKCENLRSLADFATDIKFHPIKKALPSHLER